MTPPSDLAILMALRVRGRADAMHVARAVGCTEDEAVAALAAVTARGWAATVAVGAAAGQTRLTDAGRAALATRAAAEPLDRAALAAVYDERFLAADRELKADITAWQLAADAEKPRTQGAVMASAARAGGVAAAVAEITRRFAPYPGRIAEAAAAIATGDARFVASPRVDSLHQVWFELHEDLLATLGRSRGT